MKKTLLAAALLAGFAGAASAQSSVTLYGILDGGLRYNKVSLFDGSGASNFGLAYGVQSGNRFGLRGVEDIGGGNRVTFQLESGFDLGNGTLGQGSRIFGRQAWMGLENNSWGYARIGRQLNFASDYLGALDPFSLGFGQLNMGAAFGAANTDRMSNTLKYQTPNMSGFQAGIGYAFANGATTFYSDDAGGSGAGTAATRVGSSGYNFATSNNTRQLTLGAKYANGPFYAAASWDKVYAANQFGANGSDASISSWNIGGSYDFKVAKLSVGYGQTRDGVILGQGGGGTGATLNATSITVPVGATRVAANGENVFDPSIGTNSYIIGLTVPVNPVSRVMLSWTLLTPNTNMKDEYNAQNQAAYNIGYSYDFTKRTNMYAYFGYMQNVGTVDTAKSTLLGIGMRHQF